MSWPLSSQAPLATISSPCGPASSFGSKGGLPPEVQRIDRLHVVMAIEQNVRRLAAHGLDAPDNHRAASSRMFGRLEANVAELLDQPVRGPLAIGEMHVNGGDRGDREKSEQTLERRRLTGVNSGKNIVDRGHPKPSVARCRP